VLCKPTPGLDCLHRFLSFQFTYGHSPVIGTWPQSRAAARYSLSFTQACSSCSTSTCISCVPLEDDERQIPGSTSGRKFLGVEKRWRESRSWRWEKRHWRLLLPARRCLDRETLGREFLSPDMSKGTKASDALVFYSAATLLRSFVLIVVLRVES
jgi:hypothetical protein